MAVVPIRKTAARPVAPPQSQFALMAAAQMHSEGRLISQPSTGTSAKLDSIPTQDQPVG
jgi:hypothetical protein